MALKTASFAAILVGLACPSSSHVLLKTPVPYGAATLNTNPLLEDGSDYPCKIRDGWDVVSKVNIMPIDQPQVMSFQGQATHGGGVCQLSLTTDTPPTKNSVFKVFHTIVGGCPSTNPGNVGTDPFGYGADNFTFSIPNNIPAGKNYTLAWTWFNKIGDREMYMNCAPISVPSTSHRRSLPNPSNLSERDTSSMSSLPDMFRANIGPVGNGCKTAESGTVLNTPKENLGSSIQRIGNEPLTPPVGNCGGTYGAAGGRAPQAASPGDQPSPSLQASQPAAPAAPPQPSAPAPAPAPSPSTSSAAAPPTPPPAKQSAAGAAPAPIPGVSTGTCPTPGKSVCSPDGTAWGTCDENHKVIYQKVAPNTKCDPALGVEVHVKRHLGHSRHFRF